MISELESLATSATSFERFAQQAVDLMVGELELYYVGLYLVDSAQEWVILRAGTGEPGATMVQDGHRLMLSGSSLISEAIVRKAICVAGDSPITGFFHAALPANMQVEPIPPFQFVEAGMGCPLLPETRLEVALPLRTLDSVIGALEFHDRLYKDRHAFSLLLRVADKTASLCAGYFDK